MNNNFTLNKLVSLTDTELKAVLSVNLARFAAYLDKKRRAKQIVRKKRICKYSSASFALKTQESLSEFDEELRRNSILQNKIVYEIDHIVDNVFQFVAGMYKGTSWVRNWENTIELHLAAVRQFWLDCYVGDGTFLALLFRNLTQRVWFHLHDFRLCIENAQKKTAYGIFSLKRHDKKMKTTFQTQKAICKSYLVFFCFVQAEVGLLLNKESLIKALRMANKKEKTQLHLWAEQLLYGADRLRGFSRNTIDFSEFTALILNQI